MDHCSAENAWLSLGDNAVPLRDSTTQRAEEERVERLRLVAGRDQHSIAMVAVLVTLAVAISVLGALFWI